MAGILDFLTTPESQLGIGLLAAAGSGKSVGEGLLGATQAVAAQRRGLLQDKLLQSQVDENTSQAEMRKQQLAMAKRQMEIDNGLLGYGPTPIAGAMPQSAGGAPQIGGGGAPSQGGPTFSTPGGPMNLPQLASKYGIPYEALALDLTKNGGKRIAEMISEAAKPNWQNINGNLVNTNAPGFQGGFQPGMSISANGQATAWQPDGQGGLVVGAPRGALETFRAYQGAAADNKPIKVYNPATGREEYTSEGNVVRGARNGGGDVASPGYSGGSRDAAAQEQVRMIQSELQRLPQGHPDRPALTREIARLQGFVPRGEQTAQAGNYAAGPSAAESIANEAARVKAVEQTKADITPTAQKVTAADTARDALGVIDQALNHPGLRTATGISGSIDPRNYLAGTDATNFRVLLDQIKGGVFLDAYKDLRGGGAITEVEGQKAEAAKARINRAQSPDEFVKGLQEYRAIVDRGYERARRNLPAGSSGASGSWDDAAGGQQAQAPRATMRYNPQSGRLEKVN